MLILTAVTTQSNKTVLDKVKATHCYWSHLTENLNELLRPSPPPRHAPAAHQSQPRTDLSTTLLTRHRALTGFSTGVLFPFLDPIHGTCSHVSPASSCSQADSQAFPVF